MLPLTIAAGVVDLRWSEADAVVGTERQPDGNPRGEGSAPRGRGGGGGVTTTLREGEVVIVASVDPPQRQRYDGAFFYGAQTLPAQMRRQQGTAADTVRVWLPRTNAAWWMTWAPPSRDAPVVAWWPALDRLGPLLTIKSLLSSRVVRRRAAFVGVCARADGPAEGEAPAADGTPRFGETVAVVLEPVPPKAAAHRPGAAAQDISCARVHGFCVDGALGDVGLGPPLWLARREVELLGLPPATFVCTLERSVPDDVLGRVNAALDALVAAGVAATPPLGRGREPSVFSDAVWLRQPGWRDLIDPELCLHPCGTARVAAPTWRWQPAEADVDDDGAVTWASWVNHLDADEHPDLLAGLAELLRCALPAAERVSGLRLCGRRLQVVVRVYEHVLEDDAAAADDGGGAAAGAAAAVVPALMRISDWHTDGSAFDAVVATAACYVDVADGVGGGDLEFQLSTDTYVDDPDNGTARASPATGDVVGFCNATLRHRVCPIHGVGRRRLVAFHIVDPSAEPCLPRATGLQRQLRSQRRAECLAALADAVGSVLPFELLEYIWDSFLADEGATVSELTARRDRERRRRLTSRRGRHSDFDYNESTGTETTGITDDDFDYDDDDDGGFFGVGAGAAAAGPLGLQGATALCDAELDDFLRAVADVEVAWPVLEVPSPRGSLYGSLSPLPGSAPPSPPTESLDRERS